MDKKPLTILAIDGSVESLAALEAAIAGALPEARLLKALSEAEGIRQASAADPDVILVDVAMSGQDGYAVCRRLKADERLRHIPVVFLTAMKTVLESRIRALETGAEGFLVKPVEAAELTAQVRAMAKIKAVNAWKRMETDQLSAMVAERTRELESELAQRRQAQQQLQEAYEELQRSHAFEQQLLDELRVEVDARQRSQEALRDASQFNQQVIRGATEGIVVYGMDMRYQLWNPFMERLSGMPAERVLGRLPSELFPFLGPAGILEAVRVAMSGGAPEPIEVPHQSAVTGGRGWTSNLCAPLRNAEGEIVGVIASVHDITDRRQAGVYAEMGREVLQILNEPGDLRESIRRVLAAVKARTGFDAVGIRLQEGDDFPYLAQDGFSDGFLATENSLLERAADGQVCLADDGGVNLECTCGLVLSGRTEAGHPLFTPGGSFWTNDSFGLLELPAGEDPRLHPRNQCVYQGHASVALLPIRAGDRIVGLLQLNDRRVGCFTLGAVEMLEGVASHIGAALMRKQAEESLRRTNQHLQAAEQQLRERNDSFVKFSSQVPGMLYQFRMARDGTFSVPFATEAIRDVFGCSPDDVRESFSPIARVIVAEDMPRVWGCILESARTLTPWQCEYRVRLPGGPERWLWGRSVPERQGDGSVLWHGFSADITGLKQAEQALRDQRWRLESIVESTHVGTWEWNVQTGETVFNETWAKIVGCTLAELSPVGIETWKALTHPDDLAFSEQLLERHFSGDLSYYDCECRMKHKDGHWVWVHDRGKVVTRTADGKPLMMFGTHSDITDRKKAQEQLAQAQKLEAIGRLAGGVAHDFRNQLTVIQGYAQMLQRRSLVAEEGRDMLDEIARAARRSAATTGHLLAFSRREVLQPTTVSLRESVNDLAKVLPQLIGEDIRLGLLGGGEDALAHVDVGLFEQAVMNLATNARDAMPRGGKLTIETGLVLLGPESRAIDPELPEGRYAVVSVTDTGEGMDARTASRIFEPFFTTKDVGKGTGLGLAMVYGFAKQSGGTASVSSTPGEGTTVRLYFPYAGEAAPGAEASADEGPPRGCETILVVEDEDGVRTMIAESLQESGYRVLEADSAEEALLAAVRFDGPIHMLVTDVVMPGLSGGALAAQMRARYPGIAVLYVSGYPGEELSQRGLESDCDHLAKPFTHDVLLGRVRQALDARRPVLDA